MRGGLRSPPAWARKRRVNALDDFADINNDGRAVITEGTVAVEDPRLEGGHDQHRPAGWIQLTRFSAGLALVRETRRGVGGAQDVQADLRQRVSDSDLNDSVSTVQARRAAAARVDIFAAQFDNSAIRPCGKIRRGNAGRLRGSGKFVHCYSLRLIAVGLFGRKEEASRRRLEVGEEAGRLRRPA
jgi:hypothetical protein